MSLPQKPSLPSIKEMFPEYLMQVPPHLRAPPPMISSDLPAGFSRTSDQNRPRSHSSGNHTIYGRPPHRRHSMTQIPRAPHTPQGSTASSPTLSSTPRGLHAHTHAHVHAHHPNSLRAQSGKDMSGRPKHSYNILRSDPTSSSLQHINSSATYPARSGAYHGSTAHAGGGAGVSNGSAPVFQVTLGPLDPPPQSSLGGAPIGNSHHHSRSPEVSSSSSSRRVESRGARAASASGPSNSNANYSSIISFPVNAPAGGSSPHRRREVSPDDQSGASDDGDLSGSNSGKKHVCATCSKRFNRPSSLRIHVNTHTGVTPFRCPWPNCGREFNVNSNMRRHYRNHNTPGFSRSQSSSQSSSSHSHSNPRRRRRAPPGPPQGIARGGGDSTSPTIHIMAEHRRYMDIASPPISSLSMSDDSEEEEEEDEEMSDPMDGVYPRDESDELESPREVFSPDHHHRRRSFGGVLPPAGTSSPSASSTSPSSFRVFHQHYSQTHLHPMHHSPTGGPPSSPSPSPPPPPPTAPSAPAPVSEPACGTSEPVYSPSAPYVRSLADSRVSTALRPAFHSPALPLPLSLSLPLPLARGQTVKKEPMVDVW